MLKYADITYDVAAISNQLQLLCFCTFCSI